MNKLIILPLLGVFILTGCSHQASRNDRDLQEAIDEPITTQVMQLVDGQYQVDTEASSIRWDGAKITGVNHTGTIDIKTGSFNISQGRFEGGEVVIDMTTIKSDEKLDKLEKHFAGTDFFSVDLYPESRIVLNRMEPVSDRKTYQVEGDLTIKDITRPISFEAKITSEQDDLRITADFEIDRANWGVIWGDGEGLDSLKDKYLRNEIKYNLNIIVKK